MIYILLFVLLVGAGFPCTERGVSWFLKNYYIGIPSQEQSCLPWTFFLVVKNPQVLLRRGDLVVFKAQRVGHGFDGMKMVKFVAGIPGDSIKVRNGRLYVNNVYWDDLSLSGVLKQPRTVYDRAEVVPDQKFFVLGTAKRSYDSRYWGYVDAKQTMGYAIPLL